MRKSEFWVIYLLFLALQLVLSNYAHITPYVMLTLLPVMVLCIPIRVGTTGAMCIAFATGLVVDLLSEGLLGLNALALVPVALARNSILRLLFGASFFVLAMDVLAVAVHLIRHWH